jgi:hypothetical protein
MLTTLHALLGELEGRSTQISGMNLKLSLADGPLDGKLINLANVPADLDRVARAVETLVGHAGFSIADAEVAVRNLVNERHFYGSYCELGAYEWLFRHRVAFRAQIKLSGSDILNPKGSIIDGRFGALDGYLLAQQLSQHEENPEFLAMRKARIDAADGETHRYTLAETRQALQNSELSV